MFYFLFLACSPLSGNSEDSGLIESNTDISCSQAPTFHPDIYPLFYDVCAACHYTEPEGLAFVDEDQTLWLVGVPSTQVSDMNRIEAGHPEESYLWHKLQGTHMTVGGTGYKMPEAEDFDIWKGTSTRHLTESELTDIEQWITCGAL